MATYYVSEQGAVVRKQDERLLVTKDTAGKGRAIMAEIPMHQLDQLVIMGNVQLTTQAVALLLQSGTDTVFMSSTGKARGRLIANESVFAELRLRQLQAMSDERINLALAKQIVIGKLTNQRVLLAHEGKAVVKLMAQAVKGIADMTAAAKGASNAESLRGYEGKAGAWYWPAFRQLLKRDMGFHQRIYHPSPDPINALLSFCYALLQKDVMAAVHLVGMDPYLGFFHTIQYGRPSLVLDLMEEFRQLLVDPLVLQMVGHDEIRESDFTRNASAEQPVTLKEDALKRVIKRYEAGITARVRYPFTGEEMTYRRCIELQTRQMARVIKGEQAEYRAMVMGVGDWGLRIED